LESQLDGAVILVM